MAVSVSAPGMGATVAGVRTVCSYCGVGCGIVLDVEVDPNGKRRVLKASGDKDHPANAGRLCTKGATTAEMLAAPGRLSRALLRTNRNEEPAPTDVDAAISYTAQRLRAILDEHGPDAISLYVSGQMSIEAQYLANKLAKGFIVTNQIESNSRLCMASAGSGYKLSLGADGPPGSYDDFDHADVFFVIGANMADCHPILFLRLLDRVKKSGAKLIVVDPRRNATADKADLFLPIKPGTDLALLNGLMHLLVADGHVDEEFIAEFTEGWEVMPEFLADYPPDRVAEITGIPEADLRTAARWIGEAGEWMSCWTMGLNQSTHGTWNTNALVNLHLATGAICRPGSGPFSLTGQPNAMGGREMGYMGPGLPGQRGVGAPDERAFIEQLWAIAPGTLRTDVGQGTVELFSRMAEGEIKACWIICTNPVASMANRRTVIAGLEAAEFVIAQDVFADTETNAYADVVLPGAMWAEGEGVMVNSERNLTLLQGAADPPGQALPDWQLIARVACEMGYADGFSYSSAEEVFEEIKKTWNPKTGYDLRGVTYERLRESPMQWPVAPNGEKNRNPIRYVNDGISQQLTVREDGTTPRLAFATASGKASFFPRPHLAAAEMPDDDFPFALNTGRLQHQWHTLTKTGKVAKLNKLNSGPFVEIHPQDAAILDITDGDSIEVASRRGRAVLPAVVTDRVRPGNCFAPFHWNDLFGEYLSINAVTNDAVDPISFQPEFKVCAVTLTKVAVSRPAHPEVTPVTASLAPDVLTAGANDAAPSTALAKMFGIGELTPPRFEEHERTYLAGFLAGIGATTTETVPVLPERAPIAQNRALWVDGVLAGMFSRNAGDRPLVHDTAGTAQREVVILWASQTGNAEEFAGVVQQRIAASGAKVELRAMADPTTETLHAHTDLLIVTSTFGDGDAPDNGTEFWDSIAGENAARFEDVRYAVLAFGDSSYSEFCGHGRRLDVRLEELGATRLLPRIDCEPDFEAQAADWLEQILGVLAVPSGGERPAQRGASGPPRSAGPQRAVVTGNRLLSLPGATKEVRQFTIDIADTDLAYETGDALAVVPQNDGALVEEWLAVTAVKPDELVEVAGVGELPFVDALRQQLEIAKTHPEFLNFIAERAQSRQLQSLLQRGGRDELEQWLWGRQAVDVASEFRVRASAQEWAGVFKKLQPRRYSISSSPLTNPDRVHVTVSVVRFDNVQGAKRKGVCSTYLADGPAAAPISVQVHRAPHFRPPADGDAPMIMVGPGTGIAPFLGFLDERKARSDSGDNWLFFGEQHEATDFYYRDELHALRREGILTRLDVAFSRDQRAKIYVQDRMREHGSRLWAALEDGAYFYVCGDAMRMARDVDEALREIVAHHGRMPKEDAAAYVKQLAADKRYARDVY
jgi:sulfite reductase (NADPH) flavoprotein alpha-component